MTPRKHPLKAKSAKSSASTMPATQKAIFDKLKKKGMSDKQAHAFSHHAAKRKTAAAKKKK